MGSNILQKIIRQHLVVPDDMLPGSEILLKVDQTLTHDINAVMTYLAFEQTGLSHTQVDTSVSYLDHNLLGLDYRTADDHIYLQSAAQHFGVWVSRPGNGICHAVHTERFAVPGKVCCGGDSHTPHGGAVGMLCIGLGGLEIASVMAGLPLRLKMPKVVNVRLTGQLPACCNAKDVILEMLRRFGVKGGLGKAFEYTGPGAEKLTVSQRVTITNMGAELGATTSIFPSDQQVLNYLKTQGREADFSEILPDADCIYDEIYEIDLSSLEPLCACPDQPDNVKPLREVEKLPVQQVFIGSCTNTSYSDVARAALVFRGKKVHPDVSCVCSVSSRKIFIKLLEDGYIEMLVKAGVRIMECGCGPCCAIGQSPATNGISVRTSNRNFKGRSGNPTAKVYLMGPENAAATAIIGTFASAGDLLKDNIGLLEEITEPRSFCMEETLLLPPLPKEEQTKIELRKGPGIKFLPLPQPLEDCLTVPVSLKCSNNITTDDITPASAEFSSMRSDIPSMSSYCFYRLDPAFSTRAKSLGQSIIVGGENYGQGSSREHAAINPMYLGVRMILAKSIARIHRSNLINHGIVPAVFKDPLDYDSINQGDVLEINGLLNGLKDSRLTIYDRTTGRQIEALVSLTKYETEVLLAGGLLRYIRSMIKPLTKS